eukprot:862152-Rhodomonas_salina.1
MKRPRAGGKPTGTGVRGGGESAEDGCNGRGWGGVELQPRAGRPSVAVEGERRCWRGELHCRNRRVQPRWGSRGNRRSAARHCCLERVACCCSAWVHS